MLIADEFLLFFDMEYGECASFGDLRDRLIDLSGDG